MGIKITSLAPSPFSQNDRPTAKRKTVHRIAGSTLNLVPDERRRRGQGGIDSYEAGAFAKELSEGKL
ncbi:hypothetical protein PAJ34TS1_10280 [Paenibacillus azoreducens]